MNIFELLINMGKGILFVIIVAICVWLIIFIIELGIWCNYRLIKLMPLWIKRFDFKLCSYLFDLGKAFPEFPDQPCYSRYNKTDTPYPIKDALNITYSILCELVEIKQRWQRRIIDPRGSVGNFDNENPPNPVKIFSIWAISHSIIRRMITWIKLIPRIYHRVKKVINQMQTEP